MRNRYPGRCFRCGATVQKDGGEVYVPTHEMADEWVPNGFHRGSPQRVMVVEHDACAERYAGTLTHWLYRPA